MIVQILFNIQQVFREEFADSLNSSNGKGLGKEADSENISCGAHLYSEMEVA